MGLAVEHLTCDTIESECLLVEHCTCDTIKSECYKAEATPEEQ